MTSAPPPLLHLYGLYYMTDGMKIADLVTGRDGPTVITWALRSRRLKTNESVRESKRRGRIESRLEQDSTHHC